MDFWTSFTAQALASIVGAVVGISGVFIGFALQRRATERDEFESSVQHLLLALGDYAHVHTSQPIFGFSRRLEDVPHPSTRPNGSAVGIAVNLLRLRAGKTDLQGVNHIEIIWSIIRDGAIEMRTGDACEMLAEAITEWRIAPKAGPAHLEMTMSKFSHEEAEKEESSR